MPHHDREALIARAKLLELSTPYMPSPGDPLAHHASGFAKVMCSAVFVTELDPDFAAENVGFCTAPYRERARMGKPGAEERGLLGSRWHAWRPTVPGIGSSPCSTRT